MKYVSLSAVLLWMAFSLAGCKTASSVQSGGKYSEASPVFDIGEYEDMVVSKAERPAALTARASITLGTGSKDISVNGTLRMKRDDVIRLSLTFLGMEVGRMEFTPDDVLLLDKFNKQYVRVSYSEIDFLEHARLDFNALQALFWDELFVPGESGDTEELLSHFEASETGDYVEFLLPDAPELEYKFRTVRQNGLLDETTIRGKSATNNTVFTGRYGSFTDVDGHAFPSHIQFAVTGLKQGTFSLDLSLSRFSTASDWESRTEVSSKYRQRTVGDIMKQLMSL